MEEHRKQLRKLEKALKIIKASQKWLPKLVQAMKDSGGYGIKFPKNLSYYIPQGILTIEWRIKELRTTIETLEKNRKILKPDKIYEMQFKKDMYLVKIVRFNKDSIKVKVLASNRKFFFSPFELIPIGKTKGGWYYSSSPLSEATEIKEVSEKDLVLYTGQNCTEHFEKIIKDAK